MDFPQPTGELRRFLDFERTKLEPPTLVYEHYQMISKEQIQRTSAPSRPEDARPIQRRPMTTSWEASAVPCPFGIGAPNFHA